MAAKKNEDEVIDEAAEPKSRNPKSDLAGPAPARTMPASMGATFAERAKARGKVVKPVETEVK